MAVAQLQPVEAWWDGHYTSSGAKKEKINEIIAKINELVVEVNDLEDGIINTEKIVFNDVSGQYSAIGQLPGSAGEVALWTDNRFQIIESDAGVTVWDITANDPPRIEGYRNYAKIQLGRVVLQRDDRSGLSFTHLTYNRYLDGSGAWKEINSSVPGWTTYIKEDRWSIWYSPAGSPTTWYEKLRIENGVTQTFQDINMNTHSLLNVGEITIPEWGGKILPSSFHDGNVKKYYRLNTRLQGTDYVGDSKNVVIEIIGGNYGEVAHTIYYINSRGNIEVYRYDLGASGVDRHELKIYSDDSKPDDDPDKYVVYLVCSSDDNYATMRFWAYRQDSGKYYEFTEEASLPSDGYTEVTSYYYYHNLFNGLDLRDKIIVNHGYSALYIAYDNDQVVVNAPYGLALWYDRAYATVLIRQTYSSSVVGYTVGDVVKITHGGNTTQNYYLEVSENGIFGFLDSDDDYVEDVFLFKLYKDYAIFRPAIYSLSDPSYGKTYLKTWGLLGDNDIYIEPTNRLHLTDRWAQSNYLQIVFADVYFYDKKNDKYVLWVDINDHVVYVPQGFLKLGWMTSEEGGQLEFIGNATYTTTTYIDRYRNQLRFVYGSSTKIRIDYDNSAFILEGLNLNLLSHTIYNTYGVYFITGDDPVFLRKWDDTTSQVLKISATDKGSYYIYEEVNGKGWFGKNDSTRYHFYAFASDYLYYDAGTYSFSGNPLLDALKKRFASDPNTVVRSPSMMSVNTVIEFLTNKVLRLEKEIQRLRKSVALVRTQQSHEKQLIKT